MKTETTQIEDKIDFGLVIGEEYVLVDPRDFRRVPITESGVLETKYLGDHTSHVGRIVHNFGVLTSPDSYIKYSIWQKNVDKVDNGRVYGKSEATYNQIAARLGEKPEYDPREVISRELELLLGAKK